MFSIDKTMKLAKKSKDKDVKKWYNFLDGCLTSRSGLCIGSPLADLINAIAKDSGDDMLIKLHEGSNNPDDRIKEPTNKEKL